MSGICGWTGAFPPAGLAAMAAALPGSAETWSGDGAAVAGGGLVETRDHVVAWCGHPRAPGGMAAFAPALAERGADALSELGGAFAVAVAKKGGGDLLLAADRSGTVALWLHEADGGVLFGTVPQCLDGHPASATGVDPQAIYHYVYFGFVPAPGSVRAGRSRLLPGEYASVRGGAVTRGRYWELVYEEPKPRDLPALQKELEEHLRDAVRHDMEGGAGAFLSGGIDSSTVVGLLAGLSREPVKCYSIGFDQESYNELDFARTAAKHFGAEMTEYLVTAQDVVDAIPKIAAAYGEPFGNESAVPTYYCAKLAREDGTPRLLAGDGGDELFGGNERYATQKVFELYGRVPGLLRAVLEPVVFRFPLGAKLWPVRKARSYIEQAKIPLPARLERYNYVERLGAEAMFEGSFLDAVDRGRPLGLVQESWDRARAPGTLNRMLAVDMKFTLADNDLRKVTRSCELAGTDVRFPFLSDALVEFSARLHPSLKVRRLTLRHFFKWAMRDFLPVKTLTKSKHGFGLPFGVWLQTYAPLQTLAEESLANLRTRGIVKPSFIDRLLQAHRSEHAVYYGVAIWGFMMLEQWYQAHVDRPHEVAS